MMHHCLYNSKSSAKIISDKPLILYTSAELDYMRHRLKIRIHQWDGKEVSCAGPEYIKD